MERFRSLFAVPACNLIDGRLTYIVISTIVKITMKGAEFKRLRTSIGLSQSQLARELDLYVRTISKYENDDLVIPRVTELALRYIGQQLNKKERHNRG
jgi:DNA-binding transcriptional regulator YiaG